MSLVLSECNQKINASLYGLYDFLSDQEREDKLVELLAEILRKQAIAKIAEQQNSDGRQHKDEK
ncbi:MAG: hypothetical protein H8E26_09165 [FCB group bacterium]|nr:hypothetical protein [FCB group bacterium]MBL7028970.1 hypothetical protein [Candidatus Neomarinimicrobiota bacterium]MBL7121990.1 hypothetical protein [Candidatus Neomarinimicrobiota bacterium]